MDSQYGLKSIAHYHHTVIGKATPFGEFTAGSLSVENCGVVLPDYPTIRRTNLERFITLELEGNLSLAARIYKPNNPKPQYFSDLLRPPTHKDKKPKSFGATAARQMENAFGLVFGQLDIPNSPLLMNAVDTGEVDREIVAILRDLPLIAKREALAVLKELEGKRQVRKVG